MLVALALYTSTAHAGIPPDAAERRASVRMQTSLAGRRQSKRPDHRVGKGPQP